MFFFVLEKETENCEFERKDNKQGTDSSNHQENSRAKKECYINHCPALFILFHHPPSSTPIHTYTHFYKYFIYTLKYSLFCCVSSCSFFLSLSYSRLPKKYRVFFSNFSWQLRTLNGSIHTHTQKPNGCLLLRHQEKCVLLLMFSK